MVCYFLARIVFIAKNSDALRISVETGLDLLWYGLRYDASALVLLNIPFIVALLLGAMFGHFIPGNHFARASLCCVWAYRGVNCVAILANIADAYYFPFSGKRSSLAALAATQDITHQLPQLTIHFWPVSVLSILICGVFLAGDHWSHKLALHTESATARNGSQGCLALARPLISWVVVVAGCIVLGRGGTQRKPIGLASAYATVQPELVPAVLNTTFTALKGFGGTALPAAQYYTGQDLKLWQSKRTLQSPSTGQFQGRNVVIVILESFGREYMGRNGGRPCYMPFLCDLATRSLYYEMGFANGRTSIESFYSIHAGIPSLLNEPLVTSTFGGIAVPGLARRLKDVGYGTYFFHGGRNGTMFFDTMARATGFDHYEGLDEYMAAGGKSADSDGVWGVFDGPFLDHASRKLSTVQEPFFASIFSLTSHNPYVIPNSSQGRFPKGTLPIHESIGYADNALREFFSKAAIEPWYKRTLFVITADHASISDDPEYKDLTGSFRIPIVIFDPQGDLVQVAGIDQSKERNALLPAQQVDIAPTVIDALGLEPKMESFFGRSLLSPTKEKIALGRAGEVFWATDGKRTLRILAETGTSTIPYKLTANSGVHSDVDWNHLETETRALLQSYFDFLRRGKFEP